MRNNYAEVPVRDLIPAAYNPNRLAKGQFAQLMDEVRRQGRVLKPVVVWVADDGRHHIVDGEHNWRAAEAVGLTTVPVEVVEADPFEARRQTFTRNLTGDNHAVKLGRMFAEMMTMKGMSGRDLAATIGVTEGTVRNRLLYKRAADLCAGRDDMPDDDAIAALGIREVRALIAQLEGDEDGEENAAPEPPKPAEAEPADLRALDKAWDKACAPSREQFMRRHGLSSTSEPPRPTSEQPKARNDYAAPVATAPASAPPWKPDPDASPKLPYGIDGKQLAELCEAKGTTLKAFAASIGAGWTPQSLSRLFNGKAAVPPNNDIRDALAKLQAPPREARNDYAEATRGRKPGPPKLVIPELEALLARGRTLREISAGMKASPAVASLLRSGSYKLNDELLARLRTYAASVGVQVQA